MGHIIWFIFNASSSWNEYKVLQSVSFQQITFITNSRVEIKLFKDVTYKNHYYDNRKSLELSETL